MFDALKADAISLIDKFRAHLPDGARFSQAHAQVSNNSARVIAFWQGDGDTDTWGTITEERVGMFAGRVEIKTWDPGADQPATVVVNAADAKANGVEG